MVIYTWRKDLRPSERYGGEMECRKKKRKGNTLGSQIRLASTREEKTVQYLSALTEKQQWQQSLQLILIQEKIRTN